jgi:hypothetical protein
MWIPTEINEKEMKSLGMKINATDIGVLKNQV